MSAPTPTTPFPARGRLAGIDFGTVRLGVAISDPRRTLASPYSNYTRSGPAADARYFQQLVAREDVVGFVVGLPVHMSGEESEKCRQARAFGAWLSEATGCPVRFFDERYTTREAELLLGEAHMTRKKRKRRLDMIAAQLLLAGYLESDQQGAAPAPLNDR
ncbi:MAG: Holliday junction resolvase RuvX [Planctomycetes bacterium]|nr:Holliday junction resolvase RuvX [Planctomycetota bacterium]